MHARTHAHRAEDFKQVHWCLLEVVSGHWSGEVGRPIQFRVNNANKEGKKKAPAVKNRKPMGPNI